MHHKAKQQSPRVLHARSFLSPLVAEKVSTTTGWLSSSSVLLNHRQHPYSSTGDLFTTDPPAQSKNDFQPRLNPAHLTLRSLTTVCLTCVDNRARRESTAVYFKTERERPEKKRWPPIRASCKRVELRKQTLAGGDGAQGLRHTNARTQSALWRRPACPDKAPTVGS